VDAFAEEAFKGNQAAVCLCLGGEETAWMYRVAAEMNLSETAFLTKRSEGEYDLRWFTPAVEVDLCGHATLASAHVLWKHLDLGAQTIKFHTRSGELLADRHGEGITLDFPATPSEVAEPPTGMMEGLGIITKAPVFRCKWDYLVLLDDPWQVRQLAPDHGLLRKTDCRGIIVTSRSDDPQYHFISRFFAPGSGIDEDPVTGSAHCALTPFWSERLGRESMVGYQASERSGVVRVRLSGDRVHLTGTAVTTLAGELLV
jgi:PhzF family phenazine biosynthesis protein